MRRSKLLLILLLIAVASSAFSATALKGRVAVVDGRPIALTCVADNGQTLVWIQDLEAMGWGKVAKSGNSVALQGDAITLTFKAGSPTVMVNQLTVTAQIAAKVVGGKFMVPLQFVCKTLGYSCGTAVEPVTRISSVQARPAAHPRTASNVSGAGAEPSSPSIAAPKYTHISIPGAGGRNRIVGRVTFGGKPLASIKLKLVKPDGGLLTPDRTATTADDGQFAFNDVPEGQYRVYAYVGDNPEYFNRASPPVSLYKGVEATVSDISLGKILHPVSPTVGDAVAPVYGKAGFSCTTCQPAKEYHFTVTEVSSDKPVVSGSSDKPSITLDVSSLEFGHKYLWRVTATDSNRDFIGGSPGNGSTPWIFTVTQPGVAAKAFDPTPAEKAQQIYDRACALQKDGQTAKAVEEWRKTLSDQLGPADTSLKIVRAESLVGIGTTQRREGDLDAALATFNTVLKDYAQVPSLCAESALNIGYIYQAKKDFAKAFASYQTLIKLYPDMPARSRQAQGRISDMINSGLSLTNAEDAEYQAALKVRDEFAARRAKIDADRTEAAAKGDVAAIRAQLEDSIVQNSADQLNNVARALLQLGDKETARKTFEKCLAVAAKQYLPEEYSKQKTWMHFLLWDHDLAAAEAGRSVNLYPDGRYTAEFRYLLAQSYDYGGKLDKAVKTYDDLADRYAGSVDPQERIYDNSALFRCGVILMDAGRNEEAITRFQRCIKDYPDTVWTNNAADRLKALQGAKEETKS
jgi:TolA-binding protein